MIASSRRERSFSAPPSLSSPSSTLLDPQNQVEHPTIKISNSALYQKLISDLPNEGSLCGSLSGSESFDGEQYFLVNDPSPGSNHSKKGSIKNGTTEQGDSRTSSLGVNVPDQPCLFSATPCNRTLTPASLFDITPTNSTPNSPRRPKFETAEKATQTDFEDEKLVQQPVKIVPQKSVVAKETKLNSYEGRGPLYKSCVLALGTFYCCTYAAQYLIKQSMEVASYTACTSLKFPIQILNKVTHFKIAS